MLKHCEHKTKRGLPCKKNAWSGSDRYCARHDPRHKKWGRGKAIPKIPAGPASETPESVAEAKANVAALIARSEKGNIRPRDLAELYRVFATLSELETKVAAEGIEGLIVVDLGPHQHVVVVDD